MSASPAVRGAELTLGGVHSVAQDKCVMTLCPRPQRHTGWVCGPERPLCPLRSASPAAPSPHDHGTYSWPYRFASVGLWLSWDHSWYPHPRS